MPLVNDTDPIHTVHELFHPQLMTVILASFDVSRNRQ